jgi:hypothetical protein
MAHISEDDLSQSLRRAAELVPTGAVYAHYKHPELTYTVTGHTILEANDAVAVTYKANYGKGISFTRALDSWLEQVSVEGKTVYRFVRINQS